jgi:hypothetical protein
MNSVLLDPGAKPVLQSKASVGHISYCRQDGVSPFSFHKIIFLNKPEKLSVG